MQTDIVTEHQIDRRSFSTVSGVNWPVYLLPLLLLVFGVLVAGLFFLIGRDGPDGARFLHISFFLTGRQDLPWLALAAAAYPILWKIARRDGSWPRHAAGSDGPRMALVAGALVFVAVWAGTYLVYLDFPLSMDEFMMRFQSTLVQSGHLVAPAPDDWFPFSQALRPGFLIVDQQFHYWAPGYRPGTAFLHAAFSLAGAGGVMNATFCAFSVLLVWSLARSLFPDHGGAVFWSVLLFASSAQFLITGMTPYTMTAHLFASLLWLWLFIKDRPWAHLAAMAVGAYALGLHHLHVHASFAFPFLLHLFFWRRKYLWGLAYGAVYAVAGLGWIFWMDIAEWAAGLVPVEGSGGLDGGAGFVGMAIDQGLGGHGVQDAAHWAANLTRLIAWQNLALLPLFLLGMRAFWGMPVMLRLMAWSTLTSLLPYILLMPAQGHGWGYRYLNQELGSFALIAGWGWAVASAQSAIRVQRLVIMLAIASVAIALPLRAFQAHALVAPFARAMAAIEAQDADLVILDEGSMWYGVDLVRNDPLLRNRPIVLAVSQLSDAGMSRLCSGHQSVFIGWEELQHTGVSKAAPGFRPDDARQRYIARLRDAGCLAPVSGGSDG